MCTEHEAALMETQRQFELRNLKPPERERVRARPGPRQRALQEHGQREGLGRTRPRPASTTTTMLTAMLFLCPVATSFFVPGRVRTVRTRPIVQSASTVSWQPQDLTKDCPGHESIPDDDYVKRYQQNPELWPVEFFLIVYRRRRNKRANRSETQVLVRKSANGTSKWGVGTGVPATRWMLSTQESAPLGYRRSEPRITFAARNFPEFPKTLIGQDSSWTYDKIDIREDAFNGPGATDFEDPELEEYANAIRTRLRTKLAEQMMHGGNDAWEANRVSVVKRVVDSASSLSAIQGTLRMSGLFARRAAAGNDTSCPRHVDLGENAPDPAELVQSMRVYTMFPQMPDPLPLPSTSPEELQTEIATRESRMEESGRDPHKDRHGRTFTHKSTSNVSNTIHGLYLTLDATELSGLDEVPALDLFGTRESKREWVSLQDLKVLDSDGKTISTEDTKPTFISGFIVRQLVRDGVIRLS